MGAAGNFVHFKTYVGCLGGWDPAVITNEIQIFPRYMYYIIHREFREKRMEFCNRSYVAVLHLMTRNKGRVLIFPL